MKSNRLLKYHSMKGFTLVELMVVISIISVLSVFGVINFRTWTMQSRDARRRADLEEIGSALELYKADLGEYPEAGDINQLVNRNYIPALPTDPTTRLPYTYRAICNAVLNICSRNVDCTGRDCCAYQLSADSEVDPTVDFETCSP